jgi:integrase
MMQRGQLIDGKESWSVRYYITQPDGSRKQKSELLASKTAYPTEESVLPLLNLFMDRVNVGSRTFNGRTTLAEYFDACYLPWVTETKAAATSAGYTKTFTRHLRPVFGKRKMTDITTGNVTKMLTSAAQGGLHSRMLSHIKWCLSGIYEHAIATDVLTKNPARDAKVLCRVDRVDSPVVYSLQDVMTMLTLLTPIDLQAAVAVALAYFAGLRPAEIRGLQWADYDGQELHIKRAVWRNVVGITKTPESRASVPVAEPLRVLLAKLHGSSNREGYILANCFGRPLDLDSLNLRVITPVMKKHNITWAGFYPCRRGISSLLTQTSNALNATGMLRHSNPITALQHYTRASKEAIADAMRAVDVMAAELVK